MKLKSLLTLALLLPLSMSGQRTATAILKDARTAVVQHLGISSAKLSTMKVVDNIGEIAVVSSPQAGTAFVSRTNNYERVLGVTPTAFTSVEALPCGLKLWLEAANHKLESGEPVNTVAASKASDVASFVTTIWSQDAPYNNLCPKDGTERCVTGCVATALAQIMNYYEYPARGKGMSTYSVTSGSETKEYTGLIASVYNWANMPDNAASASETEAKAVATLMRDCGYAVHMEYTTDGSGTTTYYVPAAVCSNFSYDSTAVNFLMRDYCSDEDWYGTMYSELAAKRPILFSGYTPNSEGHAFVFDGMTADGMVHINWGWGGVMDGYFDPAVMSESANFTISQYMVCGFNPQVTPAEPTTYPAPRIHIDAPSVSSTAGQLNLAAMVVNIDWRDFYGDIIYVVADVNVEDNVYALYFMQAPEDGEEPTEDDALQSMAGWEFTTDQPLCINDYCKENEDDPDFTFPAGDYEVYFLVRGIHETDYHRATTNGGREWKETFTVAADGTITFTTATAIDHVSVDASAANASSDKAYDLSGRLLHHAAKGIVIQNGRKLLRK